MERSFTDNMRELTGMLGRRQLALGHAAKCSLLRAWSDQTRLTISLAFGLCYGITVSVLARGEMMLFQFSISLLFALAIGFLSVIPWRTRFYPLGMEPQGWFLLLNFVFAQAVGIGVFWLCLVLPSLVLIGPAQTAANLADYSRHVVWGLAFGPTGFCIALGELGSRYGRTADARERRQERLAEEARMIALRAQINPHFFFNALNTIAALIPTRPDDAERAVELLATAMRPALMRDQPMTATLDQELSIANSYAQLELLRHGRRTRLSFDVDGEAMTCRLASMSIQPLIENAFRHGVGRSERQYEVRLAAVLAGEHLELEIVNAPSCAFHRLDWDTMEPAESPPGHAVQNIATRLRLLFGAEASLEIRIAPHIPAGWARMRVPCVMEPPDMPRVAATTAAAGGAFPRPKAGVRP
ncbi:MAG: histidine kinase [Sumerlaeia bacterium]